MMDRALSPRKESFLLHAPFRKAQQAAIAPAFHSFPAQPDLKPTASGTGFTAAAKAVVFVIKQSFLAIKKPAHRIA
ncbi:MAG: hypothetical protein EPN75_12445 [Beijerinckiaceae bacterium]|nr:MAG: hypothetical protein EPN75_12445 [Beijerinckiaceae bacterium]